MDRREFLGLAGAGLAGAALAQQAGESYSFVVVADPHLRENRAGEPTGEEKFRRVLTAIRTLEPAPEFMLLLGDVHPNVLERLLPESPLPIHPVAGNHESRKDRELLRRLFPDDFGNRDFYSFAHRGDLYVGLCDAAHVDHVGHFESESIKPSVGQCEWVAARLAARGEFRRVVLFAHIPPEPVPKPNGMCLGQNDARWLHALVREKRPTALFFGHLHRRAWFDIDGVPVYGMRSCNWNSAKEPVGFGHVTTTPEGLAVRFVET